MGRPAQHGSPSPGDGEPVTTDIEVTDHDVLLRLTGPGGAHLRILEKELGLTAGLRGHTVRLAGAGAAVELGERVVAELLSVMEHRDVNPTEIGRAVRTLRDHPEVRLRDLFEDVVL